MSGRVTVGSPRARIVVPPAAAAIGIRPTSPIVKVEDKEPQVVEVPKGIQGDKGQKGDPGNTGPAMQWSSLDW